MAIPLGRWRLDEIRLLGVFLFTVITSWILGIRMRRRIKADLGRKAKDTDLSSIDTWMKVDEVEEKTHPGREWTPQTLDLVPDSPNRDKPIDLFPNGIANDGRAKKQP